MAHVSCQPRASAARRIPPPRTLIKQSRDKLAFTWWMGMAGILGLPFCSSSAMRSRRVGRSCCSAPRPSVSWRDAGLFATICHQYIRSRAARSLFVVPGPASFSATAIARRHAGRLPGCGRAVSVNLPSCRRGTAAAGIQKRPRASAVDRLLISGLLAVDRSACAVRSCDLPLLILLVGWIFDAVWLQPNRRAA
jgi:hypothetical protein